MSAIQPTPVKSLRLVSLLSDLSTAGRNILDDLELALQALQVDAGNVAQSVEVSGIAEVPGAALPLTATQLQHQRCDDFSDLLSQLQALPEALPNLILLSEAALQSDIHGQLSRITERLDGQYVPIVLFGTANSSSALIEAMENGANDYIVLPADPALIKVKLQAQLRVGNMHAIMSQQHRAISNNHQHIMREQQMAKEVFDKVAHDSTELANIQHWLSPIAVFNGDILLATPTPSGSLLVLMGDFTGHGLGAAIGAIPLAATFYGMASKGFAMYDIINELNAKLNAVLPTGVFCCACVAQINFQNGFAEIWNAGLPDCYILRSDASLQAIPSSALALGILGSEAFEIESERYSLEQGDKIYLLSDGLLETENSLGEQYGEERLQDALRKASALEAASAGNNGDGAKAKTAFAAVKQDVLDYIGAQCRADDISLVEIETVSADAFASLYSKNTKNKSQQPVSWSMSYEFRADSLRHQDPVPLILHGLLEEPNLRQYSGQLFSIISELYNNALDHGLLQLSSSIKQQEQGFAKYYDTRMQRMQGLDEGSVRFELDYRATSDSGELSVEVIDTGPGFDYRAQLQSDSTQPELHGRGIALLRTICRKVEYLGAGNRVRVEYSW